MPNPFCPIERRAWTPPERLTGTEWAEAHRVLYNADKPGKFRVKETPWGAGIMDALTGSYITKVAFMKPVQIGGTTLGENVIGAWVDMDPSNILIVFSGEDVCKKIMGENIIPMFQKTPKLAEHLTGKPRDLKTSLFKLLSCNIQTGWAGSPASLSSIPFRRVMLDEVDKYPVWVGKETDAVKLGEGRTNTYTNRKKIYILSTPSIPTGAIARAIDSSGDVRDWCPLCPKCESYIRPEWEHVSWPGQDSTDDVELRKVRLGLESLDVAAVYSCPHCPKDTPPLSSDEFWLASQKGGWVSVGKTTAGDHPLSRSVGFRLSGLCSKWTRVQGAALAFVSARLEGMSAMQFFYNHKLGVPFWGIGGQGSDEALSVSPQKVWDLTKDCGERGVVPDWANCVVAGVDTGKRDHPWVVRAFGEGFRSQLLEFGTALSFSDLDELLARTFCTKAGKGFKIRRMCIDSGGGAGLRNMSRTEEVYRFAQTDPARIYAIKGHGGASTPQNPIRTFMKHYRPPGDRYMLTLDIRLSILDTGYWKDLLAGYIDQGIWLPHKDVDRNYVMQLASEHKEMVRQIMKPDGTAMEDWRWRLRQLGMPNHFWDCEVYATVAAHMIGADELVREPELLGQDEFDDNQGWNDPGSYTRNGSWI